MNLSELNFSLSTVQMVVMAALAFYTWIMGRLSASGKELQQMKTETALEIAQLRVRMTEVESVVKHMPTANQMTEVLQKLAHRESEIASINEKLSTNDHTLNRIESFLLNNK